MFAKLKKNGEAGDHARDNQRSRSVLVAVLLILVVLLSAGSGLYAGAFFAQQAPNVTITTTTTTTTTSWTTSTIWSIVTSVVYGVWTTVEYTTSTSAVTVTGSTTYRPAKIVTANGNARISTAQSKFGGASGLFNGNGAYLSTPDSADWYFGTGDFTIDFWVRFNALPSAGNLMTFFSQYQNVNNYIEFRLYNNAGTYRWDLAVKAGGEWPPHINISKNSPGLSANTWYHIAVVRSGNSWYIFQNGTQCGTTDTNAGTVNDFTASLSIGTFDAGGGGLPRWFNGWIDEYRVSKGIARWTSNFTPSTSAPTGDSNTVLLLYMDGADGSNTFIDG